MCFSLTSAKTDIVDVTLATGGWGRGCVNNLWEESRLKGTSVDNESAATRKGKFCNKSRCNPDAQSFSLKSGAVDII